MSEEGPWGTTLNGQLRQNARTLSAFSTRAWEDAKQDGCLPQPCMNPYPDWPPPAGRGFVYPAMEKKNQEILRRGEMKDLIQEPPYETRTESGPAIPTTFCDTDESPNQCPNKDMSTQLAQKIAMGLFDCNDAGTDACHTWNQFPASAVAAGGIMAEKKTDDENNEGSCAMNTVAVMDIYPCVANTLKGIVYDFQHWKELPVAKDTTGEKLKYTFSRDDRPFYILVFIVSLLLIILLLKLIFSHK